MVFAEWKLYQSNRLKAEESKKRKAQNTKLARFTGWILQAVLFIFGLGCFVVGLAIASELHKLLVKSHPLHAFYLHLKFASLFYVLTGIIAFVWCVVDYFLIYPRSKEDEDLERMLQESRKRRISNLLRVQKANAERRRRCAERRVSCFETIEDHKRFIYEITLKKFGMSDNSDS